MEADSHWDKLPNKIWVFPTDTDKDAAILLRKSIQKVAEASSFEFEVVDNSTRSEFIPEESRKKIDEVRDQENNTKIMRLLDVLAVLK